MYCDVLTKPKQGKGFRQDRAALMNCAEDYNDNDERASTPEVLLPKSEGPVDPMTVVSVLKPGELPDQARRSVLGGDTKRRRMVTWNTSSDRVDVNNKKARKRHLELLTARMMARGAAAA